MVSTHSPHTETQELICRVVARHHVVPDCGLRKLVGASFGMAVTKLSETRPNDPRHVPLLKRHVKALGTGARKHSYVQLSAAGCRRFGVSSKRSEPYGTAALNLHLAIAVFCILGEHCRYRVSREELLPHLDRDAPRANVPHCLTTEVGHPAVLRIYHAVSPAATCVKHLVSLARELERKPPLAKWASEKDYGLAVLCPTKNNLDAMLAAIQVAGLARDILIVCGLGPTASTLGEITGGAP